MLRLDKVSKNYNELVVLKDITFSFRKEGLYSILGKSGSGKSTLLRIMARVESYKGKVTSEATPLLVSVDEYLNGELSVKEETLIHQELYEDFKLVSDTLNMDLSSKTKIDKLSLGEKQRLALVLALSSRKEIVLLDEPLAGLDSLNKKRAIKLIKEYAKEHLVIVVSHQRIKGITLQLDKGKLKGKSSINNYFDKTIVKDKLSLSRAIKLELKNLVKMATFFLTVLGLSLTYNSVNNEVASLKKEIEKINPNFLINYKANDSLDDFYNEIVIPLRNELESYQEMIYSEEMYSLTLYIGDYYLDNGFLLSLSVLNESISEDEVVIGLNYNEFCLNNKIFYCNKRGIRENLIKNELIISDLHYKIKDVIDSEKTVIHFRSIERVKNIFNTYRNLYFIKIKGDKDREFNTKINSLSSLLNYDFIKASENEYLVSKSNSKYFSYDELEADDLEGCNEAIFSCSSFTLSMIPSLKKVDDTYVNNVSYKRMKELGYKEIVITSSLRNKIKKDEGERITLHFNYKESEYEFRDILIKSVIASEEDCISLNDISLLFNNEYGVYFRFQYAYGKENEYLKKESEDKENATYLVNSIEKMIYYNELALIGFVIVMFLLTFIIESKSNKKVEKFYLRMHKRNVNTRTLFIVRGFLYFLIGLVLVREVILYLLYQVGITYLLFKENKKI